MISMEILTLTIMFFTAHLIAVGGSLSNNIVTFGDSYSDNGQGFAEYARFVLRTNAVRPRALSLSHTFPSRSYRTMEMITSISDHSTLYSPSLRPLILLADMAGRALPPRALVQWTDVD